VLLDQLAAAEDSGTRLDVAALWAAVERIAPRAVVVDAIDLVEELVPDDDGSADSAMRAALAGRYNTVRPFLTLLGESAALHAAPGGERVLAAVRALPELARPRVTQKPLTGEEIDSELVTAAWKRAVYASTELPAGAVDRDAYVVCVLEALHRALLLDGQRWEAVRGDVLAGLSLTDPAPTHLARQLITLDAAWKQTTGCGSSCPFAPDSLLILDTLLNLDAGPKPEVVATDASYSDMVFGVFAILNYRFADLPDQRYWRAALPEPLPANVDLSPELQAIGGYGPLEPIARNTVNVAKIAAQWPDMLRVAGSLVTNQIRAYDLLRMFGRDGHPTPLGQAFIEYSWIAKTLHLLALVDPVDGSYQRRMNRQLTVQESRHRLGRKICHGHRGQIRQADREDQEDQLAALGLVLNAVVLWNTRFLDAIVEGLRGSGQPVRDEAVARLSPLGRAHLNCLGRYAFTTQPPAELRPLRDPNARDGEDDGEF
jgi:TnpA family transposase